MSMKSFILCMTLIFALVASGWLIRHLKQSNDTSAHNLKDNPDAFMVNATYVSYDQMGQVHNQITVAKMTHLPQNDLSELTKPDLMIYDDKKGAPWHITANYGQSQNGIEEVHLSDHVKIHQAASATNRELTITSNQLTVFPKVRTAFTDQAITIVQPGETINAVGLRADLKKGEIELLSKAHAIYEPDVANKSQ